MWTLVARKLGLRSIHTDLGVFSAVHARLPLQAVHRLREEGLTEREVSAFIAPRRTLTHRANRKEPLTTQESDRALRVARILSLGEIVFGEKAKSDRWLRKPKRQFENRTPMEMLETEIGARLVEEALHRVDNGIFA